MIMFDLEEQLRRWRLETEATLAFEPEEIDELEDHLKLAVEQAVANGSMPEHAWNNAIARVGASPSLALEFAKSKLLPALFHLVTSWWKPVVLLLMFLLLECYTMDWPSADVPSRFPDAAFWLIAWSCFATLFVLLDGRTAKIAFLLGVGNAFCLIPLLHLTFYNSLAEQMIGPGWSRMSATFGWLPIALSVIGLVALNAWAWLRSGAGRKDLPVMSAIAAAIVLVLAVSPFVSELIGNLSIRDIFSMPTAHDVTLTGNAKSDFLKWKSVDVLLDCVFLIATWLPLLLLGLASLGIVSLQGFLRSLRLKKPSDPSVFPSANDLPWIMTLATSGFCWALASSVEPNLNQQILETEKSVHLAVNSHIGYAFIVLSSTLVYLLCSYEMARRLTRAASLRLFYASMLIAAEGAVLAGVVILSPAMAQIAAMNNPPAQGIVHSAQPAWLWWLTVTVGTALAVWQIWTLWRKSKRVACETSLWKFDGSNLVQAGSLLGLIGACAGLVLMMVALVLAFESTAMISAMIAWGNSIEHPEKGRFNPFNYDNLTTTTHYPAPQLAFWIYSGIIYVSICLAIGLTVAIVLSGLEFIRFNTFRLYRARKAARMVPSTLALNE